MGISTKIILGDCSEKLKEIEDNFIDLIVTSPPYADQRKNTYGGIHLANILNGFFLFHENCYEC